MTTVAILLVGALLAGSGTEIHQGESLDEWHHRWNVRVTNPTAEPLTGMAVRLDLDALGVDPGLFAPQGTDFRVVVDGEDSFLPHWVQQWRAFDDLAIVWVRIPFIEADSSVQLSLLGWNPLAPQASDGLATFDAFDAGPLSSLSEATEGPLVFERLGAASQPLLLDRYRLARFHPTSESPLFEPSLPTAWDDDTVRDPELLLDDRGFVAQSDGQYVMYYSGGFSPRHQIGRAVSPDGRAWVREPAEPVLTVGEGWESYSVAIGSVLELRDGSYRMYYHGYTLTPRQFGVGVATSADGVVWERYEGNPVLTGFDFGSPSTVALPHTIRLANGSFAMMAEVDYSGRFEIVLATSDDGFSFTAANGGAPVLSPEPGAWDHRTVANPKLLELEPGSYLLGYNGARVGNNYSIGLATSADLLDWTRYEANPVLERGTGAGSWDDARIEGPIFSKKKLGDAIVPFWYFGGPNHSNFRIAMATCDQSEPVPARLRIREADESGAWALVSELPERFAAGVEIERARDPASSSAGGWVAQIADTSTGTSLGSSGAWQTRRRLWIEESPAAHVLSESGLLFRIAHATPTNEVRFWNGGGWGQTAATFHARTPATVEILRDTLSFVVHVIDVSGVSVLPAPAEVAIDEVGPFLTPPVLVVGDPRTDAGRSSIDVLHVRVGRRAREPLVVVAEDPIVAVADPLPADVWMRARGRMPTEPPIAFHVEIGGPSAVHLRVFDVRGRLVRDLGVTRFDGGFGSLVWDGRDQRGRVVAGGVYFADVTRSGAIFDRATQRVVLLSSR